MTAGLNDAGYRIIQSVLTPDECEDLIARLSQIGAGRSRAGARHLMKVAEVAGLARDPRLLKLAAGALGGWPVAFRVTLFEKSQEINWLIVWHQDTALPLAERLGAPGWGPWSVKAGIPYAHAPASALERIVALRVHLDDSHADNGPLRVLPGSHRLGVLADDAVRRLAKETPSAECVVPKGGVLAMYPLIVHASSKSRTAAPRRVLHIEYSRSLVLATGIRLAVA